MSFTEWFIALWLLAVMALVAVSVREDIKRKQRLRADRAIRKFDATLERIETSTMIKRQERDEAFQKADRYYRDF